MLTHGVDDYYSSKTETFVVEEMSGTFKKIRSLLGSRFNSSTCLFGRGCKKRLEDSNKKAKGVIVFAIVAVLLVSVFAFLPKGNNSTPDIIDPTVTPMASPNNTLTPTAKPAPSNPFSQITKIIGGIGNDIATTFTPPKPPGTIEIARRNEQYYLARGGGECLALFPAWIWCRS